MASGWNLWVWLQCIGVASGCCCKGYIDILTIINNFPYSTCISSFFGSSIPTSLFIFKMYFRSCLCYFVQYNFSKGYSKNIRDRSKKSRSREYNDLIISIRPSYTRHHLLLQHCCRKWLVTFLATLFCC